MKKRAMIRRSRSRAKANTRERLLQAAIELLHEGGEGVVTTVSLTQAAGVVQSAFYKHFTNVEECLATALAQVTDEIRNAVAAARQAMYDQGAGAGVELEQSYLAMYGLVEGQRPIVQLFLRYRSDPLALGGVMYRLARGLSDDLAGQLRGQFAKSGAPDTPPKWMESLADQLIAASLAAIEAFLEDRGPPPEQSARILAACATGACLGLVECLRSTEASSNGKEKAAGKR